MTKAKKFAAAVQNTKSYHLGIDIGGTGVDAQLFEMKDGKLSKDHVWELKQKTKKGVEPHAAQIANMIIQARTEAEKLGGILVEVGIGSPGRFKEGVIKPGTNANLGLTPNEFDGVNLKERYTATVNAKGKQPAPPIHVINDGDAMLAGIIDTIQTGEAKSLQLVDQRGNKFDKHSLLGQHVGLLGIGTGIGHAIVKFDTKGNYRPATDGHASKLRLKVAEKDGDWFLMETVARILKAEAQKKAKQKDRAAIGDQVVMFKEDYTIRAEDLFRGPTINAFARLEKNKPPLGNYVANIDDVNTLRFAGKYIARLIAEIRSGKPRDIVPANGWSAPEKAEAAATSVYFIGSGLGSTPLGKEIIRYAGEELERMKIHNIRLVHFPKENVAARAAAVASMPAKSRGTSLAG